MAHIDCTHAAYPLQDPMLKPVMSSQERSAATLRKLLLLGKHRPIVSWVPISLGSVQLRLDRS